MTTGSSTIEIRTESPLSDDARGLIAASQAAMEEVYPPEDIFSLDAEELAAPNAQFMVARLDDRPIGCVALIDNIAYGEIKRLFVDSSARGLGLGRILVETLEDAARDIGLQVLRLETGPELAAAVRVYRGLGYRERTRFGDYADHPSSLFMEKSLG